MTDPDFLKRVRAMARKKQASLGAGPGALGRGEAGQGISEKETGGQADPGRGSIFEEPGYEPCCDGRVHIAYRGVSDDKMYISHNRSFQEIKYFRPHGLRIFCAACRRRLN